MSSRRTDAKRKARRRKRKEKASAYPKESKCQQVQRRFLTELGLWSIISPYKACFRSRHFYWPKATVVISADSPTSESDQEVIREVNRYLDSPCISIGTLKTRYSPQEAIAFVAPLVYHLCFGEAAPGDTRSEALLQAIREKLELYRDVVSLKELWKLIQDTLNEICATFSKLDSKLYYFIQCRPDSTRGPFHVHLELHSVVPERRLFAIDGSSRAAFRCSTFSYSEPLEWITWSSRTLRIPGPECDLPVYIQSHALHRVIGENGRLKKLVETSRTYLLQLLAFSLIKPIVVATEAPQSELLIEFGHENYKLGYLVARILPEAILIRTFLFLTMDGTPEGDEIRRRLGANRHDKAYVGLDTPEGIVASDIAQDEVLRQIFRDCRCEHLFELITLTGGEKIGRAAEIRQYFQLDDRLYRNAQLNRLQLRPLERNGRMTWR